MYEEAQRSFQKKRSKMELEKKSGYGCSHKDDVCLPEISQGSKTLQNIKQR